MYLNMMVDRDSVMESILERRNNDDILDFILKLDLRIAEVDFTQILIQKLVESLTIDLTKDELTEWLSSEIVPTIEGSKNV